MEISVFSHKFMTSQQRILKFFDLKICKNSMKFLSFLVEIQCKTFFFCLRLTLSRNRCIKLMMMMMMMMNKNLVLLVLFLRRRTNVG